MLSTVILLGIIFVSLAPRITKAAGPLAGTYLDEDYYDWVGEPSSIEKKVAIFLGMETTSAGFMVMKFGDIVPSILTFDQGGGPLASAFTNVRNSIVTTIIPAFQAVGYGMVAMFFMVKLLEHATSQQMTLESFVKMFTKLIVGVVAIDYSPQIFNWFFQIGQALGNIAKNASFLGIAGSLEDFGTVTKSTVEEIAQNCSLAGGLAWLFTFSIVSIMMLIIFIFEVVLMGIAFFISFSRMFEICLRGAFLPIGLALLSENGWQGGGGRYVKKFLACCSKIMVLVMTSRLISAFMSYITMGSVKNAGVKFSGITNGIAQNIACFIPSLGEMVAARLWGIILCIFIGLAGCGLMFKADGLVNDIFGA